jgi:superfamily II DNA helicase RecQ
LSSICELSVLLTATFSEEMQIPLRLMECHFDEMIWVDLGNQRLKNLPAKYYKVPSKKWLMEFLPTVKKNETNLIFCAYRQEVAKLAQFLEREGYVVWTCLGGEASAFSQKVQTETAPDFIIATSVLSHGVNLPTLKRVIFFYEIKDLNFWIQMVARGGRHGEQFEVFSLENPQGIKWSRTLNILAIQGLSLKMKLIHIWKEIEAWFLKASSSVKSPTKNEI